MRKSQFKLFLNHLFYSFLHSLFLIILSWWWLTLDFTFDIEKKQTEIASILKRTITKDTDDFAKDFIFLDISGAKKLVPREGRIGLEVITDRQKLADFLNIVNKVSNNNYKYILCDLLFDRQSNDDKKLGHALGNTARIITASTLTEGKINSSVFPNILTGYVGYNMSSGSIMTRTILKYKLISGSSFRSLPVEMYERLHGQKIEKFAGLALIGGRLSLNNPSINFRIRNVHLQDEQENNKIIAFEDLLTLLNVDGELFFNKFLKNKIIVIGDFETDMHETILGPMPGSLILANIYLSLKEGDTLVTLPIILYILVSFILVSWLILFPPWWVTNFHKWTSKVPLGLLIGELFIYFLLIGLISIACYLVFNFQLNIASISIYLTVISYTSLYRSSIKSEN